MPRAIRVWQKRLADSGLTTPVSSYESFEPDVQVQSRRRLSGVALIYGGAWTAAFASDWMRAEVLNLRTSVPGAADFVRYGLCVGLALSVFLLARSSRLSLRWFYAVAIGFEILGGIGINSGLWNWQRMYSEIIDGLRESGLDWSRLSGTGYSPIAFAGVPWTAVWLLVFPLVVPMPQRWSIPGAIATAATIPGLLLASQLAYPIPELVRPYVAGFYLDLVVPTLITVGIAVFACHVISRLNRELSRARRLGSYDLTEKIGEGGMGEVWKARHRMLVRPAAIKLIRPDKLGDQESGGAEIALRRFEREAQATAALCSPHTIEIYDFGISNDGAFYYVMELLDGMDLRTLVERTGPMPFRRAVHILRGVCHSLADAHASGMVHRDIKPANVFVSRRGLDYDFVKVLDFGLVKEFGGRSAAQLTQDGSTTGTPAFMAPEAAADSRAIDHRADLYSLACVGYWLLTGQLVFEGPSPFAILMKTATEAPVPPSCRTEIEVPEELDRIILACLAKRPADRPQSARAIAGVLAGIEAKYGAWPPEQAEKWWQLHQPAGPDETVVLPPVPPMAVPIGR